MGHNIIISTMGIRPQNIVAFSWLVQLLEPTKPVISMVMPNKPMDYSAHTQE